MSLLFSETKLGALTLQNRLVMAPLTRCRATGNVPNALMAEYYAQRGGAGLIVSEGTSPSPNGLGYARIPGIFSQAQIDGWAGVTRAVHAKGAKMFIQLMHTGRVTHPLNLPPGARMIAPSAVAAAGEMYTDAEGMKPQPVPEAIKQTMRRLFKQSLILSGGYDAERAERDLAAGKGDLIAVGRGFLANPDLPARWRAKAPLNPPDMSTFYTPGLKGYTDYPTM